MFDQDRPAGKHIGEISPKYWMLYTRGSKLFGQRATKAAAQQVEGQTSEVMRLFRDMLSF